MRPSEESLKSVVSETSLALCCSPSGRRARAHGDPSGPRPGVQPYLPSAASSSGSPAAIWVEAGHPPPDCRTVQWPERRHELPRQSFEQGGLWRVHLWHHQRGRGRTLHVPGHRWALWFFELLHFSHFIFNMTWVIVDFPEMLHLFKKWRRLTWTWFSVRFSVDLVPNLNMLA